MCQCGFQGTFGPLFSLLNERPNLSPSRESKSAKFLLFPLSLGGHVPVAKALSVTLTNPKVRRQCQKETESRNPPWQSRQLK